MKISLFVVLGLIMILLTFKVALASPGGVFVDPCYSSSWVDNGGLTGDLVISNDCVNNSVEWLGDLNLTVLGSVVDGEVIIGSDWIFVDSSLRPDLDSGAKLFFKRNDFAVEPVVFKDGSSFDNFSLVTSNDFFVYTVTGFSNYSLSFQQDFLVYFDYEPELKSKVYQTVDLGDSRRVDEYSCIEQVFAKNPSENWVLIQTTPERSVQARLLGNPDVNQPESLGYFVTKNGFANTYFMGDELVGYVDYHMVIQCTSNSSSKLVYEAPILPEYSPYGRAIVSRGYWFTRGDNAFYVVISLVVGLFLLWMGGMVWNSLKR